MSKTDTPKLEDTADYLNDALLFTADIQSVLPSEDDLKLKLHEN